MIQGDVSPDAVRRPGAMTLNLLNLDIEIKCMGGT